jgi:hypothetical protein
MSAMTYRDIVTIEPGKRGGRPCVRGLRIAVADVLGWLAAGMSHEQIRAGLGSETTSSLAPSPGSPSLSLRLATLSLKGRGK